MKDSWTAFWLEAFAYLLALAAILFGIAWHVSQAVGAPAPIERQKRARSLPRECVMHWYGASWATRFTADGQYEARRGGTTFVGVWWLEKDGVLDVLVIHESTNPSGPFQTYRVWLSSCWKEGCIGSVKAERNFRLQSPAAK